MNLLKKILLKTLEVISYLLIVGIIYKYFFAKKVSIDDLPQKLEEVSEEFEGDLAASQEQYQEDLEGVYREESRIQDLSGSDLAAEFDSEFD